MKTKTTYHRTILWAEDDPDDRQVICSVVDALDDDYTIQEAENGCDVLRYLHDIADPAHFPCLVVLDINMPKLTGLQTLACLKKDERYKELNIAVFTTSSSPFDRRMCERYGVPIFTKPSSYAAFEQAVTELLQLCHVTGS